MPCKVEAVSGYFHQADPATDATTFDYTRDFGLIDHPSGPDDEKPTTTGWSAFKDKLHELNKEAPPGTTYRLIILGRHGQGWHNVAEAKYGTEWDGHYSKLEEVDGTRLLDPELTETGRKQARLAHDTFARALEKGMPAPEVYMVSPLDRCLETCSITFSDLNLPEDRPFRPKVEEVLREVLGVHTCDQRNPKSLIIARLARHQHHQHHQRGPTTTFTFPPDFADRDPLWRDDWRETDGELDARVGVFLDRLFSSPSSSLERERGQGGGEGGGGGGDGVVSLTTHSGWIASFLRVVGHRVFPLPTGAVIPVLVRVVADG